LKYCLTVDFGSTYTKMCAVDVKNKKVIGTSKAFTTIGTDVREGYCAALKELEAAAGRINFEEKLACSSAGGGLKMIAAGLVPELTVKAARMAASSAGAKVTNTFSYELSSREQEEIYKSNPDIVLLCGGTDGGNREVIIHNAKKISEIERSFSIIYAGNKTAADDAEEILKRAGKNVIVCGNVMPAFNVLDIAPAKNAIRSLFIEKIVEAKGLSKIQEEMTAKIIPTPLAVFEGAELLSSGCAESHGLGDLLAVDIGGATTDVYTMCDGKPSGPGVVVKGLSEPFALRSVEGDLGLRYNIDSLAESASIEKIADDLSLNADIVREWISFCKKESGIVSEKGSDHRRIDDYLANHAVKTAVERHCGTIEGTYTPLGEIFIVTGKDLTNVPLVIGVGGPVINAEDPAKILRGALKAVSGSWYLKPEKPKFMLDGRYIFASMGLAGKVDPPLALKIMKDEITEI